MKILVTVLQTNNLSKNYAYLKAVNDISIKINKGNVYGILGPNGSGKSTTLGMILNVVNKTSGNFQWFDAEIDNSKALKKIGAIIEHPNFYPYMTAYQNLKLVCKIKEIDNSSINNVLETVGLIERKNSKFSDFSLGMKQRLAIASALLNNPEVLILDEPTNGLDPQGIHQIREIINNIAKNGTTILLASHLLDEVEKVCSHVLVLSKGKKLYSGRVDKIISCKGFFDMKSNQLEKLTNFIEKHPKISRFEINNDKTVRAFLSEKLESEDFMKSLVKENIILTEFIKRKKSLEEQFLQLTEKK
jgi:ABC-2 type transport system ATP-binding protein